MIGLIVGGSVRILLIIGGCLAFLSAIGLQIFTPAAASNSVPSACRGEQVTRLPVRFESDVVFVTLTLNRVPVQFLVDTGTEWSTISQQIVDQLHLPIDPARTLRTLGADSEALSSIVSVNSVKFGNVELRDHSFGILNVPRVSGTAADPAGVLGLSSLIGFDFSFDLKSSSMTIYSDCEGISAPGWDNSTKIPLEIPRNKPSQLKVTINVNSVSIPGIVDTGAPITAINIQAAKAAGILIDTARNDRNMSAIGIGGNRVECFLAIAPLFKVGPVILNNVPVAVANFNFSGIKDDRQILLGIDFLKHYKFLISTRNRIMYLN